MAGEVVKARKTLTKLREEITEAAKERSREQDIEAALKVSVANLEAEKLHLSQELATLNDVIVKKRKEIGILEEVADGKRYVVITIDSVAETSALSLSEIDKRAKELLDQVSVLERESVLVGQDLEGKQLLRARFEDDIRRLIGEKISLETGVAALLEELESARLTKDDVFGAIDQAMSKFRLFQRRIGQLSRETGYVIGYKDPQSLLDKNSEHA